MAIIDAYEDNLTVEFVSEGLRVPINAKTFLDAQA